MKKQTRNTWITQDDPQKLAMISRHKDDYSDILAERRVEGELRWCMKTRDIPRYKYNEERNPKEVFEHALTSDRVKYACEETARESGRELADVQKEARAILEEMKHTLSVGAIRCFAFVLAKVMKSLFKRIYVNDDGIEKVRELVPEYPVLFLPSHRSYLDFLLLSYVCYEHDLPLPVIAAAMDFMSMKFVGWLFRNCGAFFIRRSFGSDRVYWALFTEYVQSHICNGDNPMEFYVEGTRSRTQKSYTPRTGMLENVLEPYFKGQVPDIVIIPVSISYDRILEESLYAYELMGIPKPKESTSGLFRARNVLSEDFGNVHIHFGEALSVRQLSDGKLDRLSHCLAPRYVYRLTSLEQEFIEALAYHVIIKQQQHMVLSPFSLTAAVLMLNPAGLPLAELLREVEWLKATAASLGAYVDWPGTESPVSVLRHTLEVHKSVASVSRSGFVTVVPETVPPGHVGPKISPALLQAAAALRLSLYRNQLLHVFAKLALVSLAVTGPGSEAPISMATLRDRYYLLEQLMSRDFIFAPGHTEESLQQSMDVLRRVAGLTLEGDTVRDSHSRLTTVLAHMFEPFLVTYWVVIQYLLAMPATRPGHPTKRLARGAQRLAGSLLSENVIRHAEALSLDTLGNSVGALADMGCLLRIKGVSGETHLVPQHVALARVCQQLGAFVELPVIPPGLTAPLDPDLTLPAKL